MYATRVSNKGWVIIPQPLREKYGLEEGARLQVVDYGGVLALARLPDDPVEALHGMLEGGSSLTSDLLAERAHEPAREDHGG